MPLTAALMLAALAPVSALRAADITEAEARAIGVDAYLYFYPLITMDVTRRQMTNIEAGKSEIGGPPNMFVNVPAFPTADMRVGRPAELRHAVLQRLARHDEGAHGRVRPRHRRALLPAADARHVDRRIRLARMAYDRHGSGDLSRDAAGLAAGSARPRHRGVQAASQHTAYRGADAVRVDHRAHEDRRAGRL